MDQRTVMLMLAVCFFLFGLLLVVFKYNERNSQNVPFWIQAKFFQAAGSLLLSYKINTLDGLTVLAISTFLLGWAYEAWAIRIITGYRVRRWVHLFTSLVIVLAVTLTLFIPQPSYRTGVVFLLQGGVYFLPSLFLLRKSDLGFLLRFILAMCYGVAAAVFLSGAFASFVFPELVLALITSGSFGLIPGVIFCTFLMASVAILLLAKDRSDIQLREVQRDLEKSELRFQQIVETANEGILIFDDHYNITFANHKMASALGLTVDELLGKSYISLFPQSQLEVYRYQESLQRKGEDTVYECCLLRRDGQPHWFLVSAKAVLDDAGRFEGSFAMLTDIHERKEMELLLEESNRQLQELSNKDGLTGIANRRYFDATLEQEYSRLRRTNSQLSIILLDIDHFKEYNDFYGHVMGDRCLRKISRVLTSCINRPAALAARYGGEEFACILPDTDIQSAVQIAEKIRQGILELQIEHQKSPVSRYVTASFGVATVQYSPQTSLEDIIASVDKLLYQAKISGRNMIEYAKA